MADDWPLSSYLKLGALPGAVTCARLHARQIVWEWGYGEHSDTVELLASELTTNAVHASRALRRDMPIRLWLLSDKARIPILVWDASPNRPALKDVGDDAGGGRGLVLVEAFSEQWNWYTNDRLGGKVVWCEIDVTGLQEPDYRLAAGPG